MQSSQRFTGRIAIITGAASGIGAATARQMHADGATVVLADINQDGIDSLAQELGLGDRVMQHLLDVSDQSSCAEVVDAVDRRFGRLDILVNSAGITPRTLDASLDYAARRDRVMQINLKGTMMMSHCALPVMLRNSAGAIVNLASIMSLVTYHHTLGLSDGFNPYPQSKGGVLQLTRDMGVAQAGNNIRVNCVCPGFVHTAITESIAENPELMHKIENMHPMGRLGRAEEISSVICFLASDEASFVTAAEWRVDGGYVAA